MATFSYADPPNDTVSRIRLLIVDIDLSVTTGDRENWTAFFSNEEIEEFYTLSANNIWRAAAMALRTIAVSKSLLAKAFHIGDYSESATEIDIANILNQKAAEYESLATSYGPLSTVQEFDYNTFSWRARQWRKALVED